MEGPMNYYFDVIKKYAVFKGRARRQEYWMFFLFNMIVSFVLGMIEGFLGINKGGDTSVLGTIYTLAVLLPSIAVGVRRMHDVGKSGWYLLVPLYNLILACTVGDAGDNQYGPDPNATA
jgi:uncharacterized membrane protein YhaH (DUF805 family)